MYIALIAVLIPAFIQAQPTNQDKEVAKCPRACGYNMEPVCGSNGQTYDNLCLFESARDCNNMPELTLANKDGPCEPEADCYTDKEPGNCRGYMQKWHFNMAKYECSSFVYSGCDSGFSKNRYDSKEECEQKCAVACPKRCPNTQAPICGNNGETYSNLCQMKRSNCNENTNVEIAYEGECSSDTSEKCEKACGFNYEPVCGSNGVTYSNPCLFENARNCKYPDLNMANGECEQ